MSDHFNGKQFFNPTGPVPQPFSAVPRMLLERGSPWPARIEEAPQKPPTLDSAVAVVTFIGHATFLIQTAAGNIITDPGCHTQRRHALRTFPLTIEGFDEPLRALEAACRTKEIPAGQFTTVRHGGSIRL